VCYLENLKKEAMTRVGSQRHKKKNIYIYSTFVDLLPPPLPLINSWGIILPHILFIAIVTNFNILLFIDYLCLTYDIFSFKSDF